MKDQILAIDVGTTAIKAGVYNASGTCLGTSYLEYSLINFAHRHIEQDAEDWWRLTGKVISQVMQSPLVDAEKVVAMGISAQGISFVPVDDFGKPLCNAFSWLDTRAESQARRVSELFSSPGEAFQRLGIHPLPTYTLPKILWLKEHQPEIFAKTAVFSTCLDFLNRRLVGQHITDYSIAGGTLMHDLKNMRWAKDLLDDLGIPPNKLPEIGWAGSLLGEINSDVALELGLRKGLQVVLGGHDQECAALGAGLHKGEVSMSLGTASILITPIDSPITDAQMRIPCYPHVERNQFVLEAVVSTTGAALRWIRDLFNSITGDNKSQLYDYANLDRLAAESKPGANGLFFYPHLSGATSPHWNHFVTGSLYGITLTTNKADWVRAVLEGWCFQLRSNLEVIETMISTRERIVIFGGAAKSRFFPQLLANVLNRPIFITQTTETALLGAAMLAGLGIGFFTDLESIKNTVRSGRTEVDPQPRTASQYNKFYFQYREVENQMV